MKIKINEGITNLLGGGQGISGEGDELQVQIDGDNVAVVDANAIGSQLVVMGISEWGGCQVSLDNCYEDDRSPKGIRPFSYLLTCGDKNTMKKTANKVWDSIMDVVDLDDLDYTIDQINASIPKIARKFGFEKF